MGYLSTSAGLVLNAYRFSSFIKIGIRPKEEVGAEETGNFKLKQSILIILFYNN